MKLTRVLIAFSFCTVGLAAKAQKDTTKKQTIDITSSYKPVLRNPAKVNLAAANLPADTTKTLRPYSVPPQNLFYTHQPVSLKPLALSQDTTLQLGVRNFIKAGIGNLTTPYASAGFSFGDGKKSLVNVYADMVSSRGKIENQDYSRFNVKGSGSLFTNRNEVYGSIGMLMQDYHLYGYDHSLYNYAKKDVLHRFRDLSLKGGLRNKDQNETGFNYNPNAEISVFGVQRKLTESTLVIEAPVEKTFNDVFSVKLALKGDFTSYTSKDLASNVDFNNSIFHIAPELVYATEDYNLHAGVSPTWNNGKLTVFPNFYGEAQLPDRPFLLQAGFVGRFIKNTYRNLSMINPYLATLPLQLNTQETELYGGIKTSIGKHFNFSAKAGLMRYKNLPFYINDTASDGKSFIISNESKVNNLRLHADMSFISQDKFTITGGLTFNGYTGMQDNDKAWGTIPLDISASLRWWAFERVLLKGDFRTFTGGPYLLKNNEQRSLGGAADLSAGIEFEINKNFSAWFDVNNLLNNRYERWNNYEVYGLNVLGGVIYKF